MFGLYFGNNFLYNIIIIFFLFVWKAAVINYVDICRTDDQFAFRGAGTTLFGGSANTSAVTDQDSLDDGNLSQEANVHFEPVVTLPEVTDLKTGEEGCRVLFCQRARLYRFTDKQWKERGIGEMKLLRNNETGPSLNRSNLWISWLELCFFYICYILKVLMNIYFCVVSDVNCCEMFIKIVCSY